MLFVILQQFGKATLERAVFSFKKGSIIHIFGKSKNYFDKRNESREKKGNISHRKRSPKGEKYARKILMEKEGYKAREKEI